MTEFVAFSELHAYKNYRKSYNTGDFRLTSWVASQLDVLDQIFTYAEYNSIKDVIFGGDLFEEKNRIPQDLYNLIWESFRGYSNNSSIIFNTGNHDIYTKERDSALKPFSDTVSVITKPEHILNNKDSVIIIVPYGMVNEEVLNTDTIRTIDRRNKFNRKLILFLHEDINELEYSNRFKSKAGLLKQMLSGWDFVFNGHIHKAQIFGNIINMGSVMRMDFGEQDRKYFYHYKDGEIEQIEIKCPEFITVSGFSTKIRSQIENDNYNFYRVDIHSEELSDNIFKKYNVFPNIIKVKEREKRITEDMTEEDEIIRYVEMAETELNGERLIRIGKEIIGC